MANIKKKKVKRQSLNMDISARPLKKDFFETLKVVSLTLHFLWVVTQGYWNFPLWWCLNYYCFGMIRARQCTLETHYEAIVLQDADSVPKIILLILWKIINRNDWAFCNIYIVMSCFWYRVIPENGSLSCLWMYHYFMVLCHSYLCTEQPIWYCAVSQQR